MSDVACWLIHMEVAYAYVLKMIFQSDISLLGRTYWKKISILDPIPDLHWRVYNTFEFT